MIINLTVRNFALIENCELNLSDKLNIITGETGAGKSIIIQALAILLGDRASVEQIRTGQDEAVLTAVISIENNQDIIKYLDNLGISIENDEIVLRRNLLASGKSRSFINTTQVTSKELSYISSILFDFHGQHEGIGLLKRETHIKYLDGYLKVENELSQIAELFYEINNIKKEILKLEQNNSDKEKKLDLLRYEVEEIEKSKIEKGEDEELSEKIKLLSNMEKVVKMSNDLSSLFGEEMGITHLLKSARNLSSQLSELDTSYIQDENNLTDIYYKIEDIQSEINNRISRYQFDPELLDQYMERSALYDKLKRKYGNTYEEIMNYLKNAQNELSVFDNQDEYKEKLLLKFNEISQKYTILSLELSEKRKKSKSTLENLITNELKNLGMSDPAFEIKIESESDPSSCIEINDNKVKYYENGIDKVEFFISPNKGEPLKNLYKIASGGELSRIILALKSILGKTDSVRTMIFDEIDVGIGGKVAMSVSNKIKEIANNKQIICITHLPQIAAAGTKNFLIHKEVDGDRTFSKITELNRNYKIKEIARMLSGNITETSIKHAEELINSYI